MLRGVLEDMRRAPGAGSQPSPSTDTHSHNPNPNTACMPCANYHYGRYFYDPNGPTTVDNRDSAHDTCMQMLNDVLHVGTHDSMSDMINECVSGGQCDGSSGELAGEAAGVQQSGRSGSEPELGVAGSEPVLVDDAHSSDDNIDAVIDHDVLESELKDVWSGPCLRR